MFDLIRPTYDFALIYAQKIVEAIPDERLCDQPVQGCVMNHPAFLLGHLAWANDNGVAMIGQKPALADLKELYGQGAKPQSDRAIYHSKEELIAMLKDSHGRLWSGVEQTTTETFSQPAPERMRARFPTVGHLLVGLMTTHFGSHLGQMSAWRRAMGFPSVF